MGTREFMVDRIPAPGTLTDRVFKALTQLITGEDFHAGSRLPSELKMASRFGVSRTVIREAVSRLKSEGLVESRQGSGVYVRERNLDAPFRIDRETMGSIRSVQQVFELRLSLEGEVASLAAKRRSRQQMATIKRSLKLVERDERDGINGVDVDIAFHRSIAEATGNPHFLALTEFLFNCLIKTTRVALNHEAGKDALSRQVNEEHHRIVDAISKRDAEAARTAAREHIEGALNRLGSLNLKKYMVQSGSQTVA